MPRISMFYGIVVTMYSSDHAPPHFHARYGGTRPRSRSVRAMFWRVNYRREHCGWYVSGSVSIETSSMPTGAVPRRVNRSLALIRCHERESPIAPCSHRPAPGRLALATDLHRRAGPRGGSVRRSLGAHGRASARPGLFRPSTGGPRTGNRCLAEWLRPRPRRSPRRSRGGRATHGASLALSPPRIRRERDRSDRRRQGYPRAAPPPLPRAPARGRPAGG